jgi:PmbA protein
MKQESLANFLLAEFKKKGADDVVIHLDSGNHSHIKFSNSKVTTTKNWNLDSLSVFVTKDQRILMSSLKTFSKSAAKDLVKEMMQSISKLPQNSEFKGIAQGPFKYKKINDVYDQKVVDMQSEMVDIVKQGIDVVKKKTKKAAGVFEKGHFSSYLITSGGVEAREKGTSLYLSMKAMLNSHATGHTVGVSRVLKKFDYERQVEDAIRIARLAKLPRKSLKGKFDVLFSPLAFANVLDHVGSSASMFSVEAGLSCLGEAMGKKIAHEDVTLYDDGTIANGEGSTSFDNEGYPTQRTALLERGVFKNFLHNTSSAKRYKTKSTGNAGLLSPDPHNLVLKKGKYSFDEMIGSIKKGLYITNVWYTRFNNHATGDFSTIPRDGAFYVENGEIKHALKDVRVSENLLGMLSNVSMIGKDVEQIRGWEVSIPTFTPPVLVNNVNITKPH